MTCNFRKNNNKKQAGASPQTTSEWVTVLASCNRRCSEQHTDALSPLSPSSSLQLKLKILLFLPLYTEWNANKSDKTHLLAYNSFKCLSLIWIVTKQYVIYNILRRVVAKQRSLIVIIWSPCFNTYDLIVNKYYNLQQYIIYQYLPIKSHHYQLLHN